jgi:hypothetical protein
MHKLGWQVGQQSLGTFESEKLQNAEVPGQPAQTEPLIHPQKACNQAKAGQVHEEPAEDHPPKHLDRPGAPRRLGFERRSQRHLQRIHVHSGGADRRAGVAHQAIQLMLDEVRRNLQMTLGQRSGHTDPPARPFRLVQRKHVRWTRR